MEAFFLSYSIYNVKSTFSVSLLFGNAASCPSLAFLDVVPIQLQPATFQIKTLEIDASGRAAKIESHHFGSTCPILPICQKPVCHYDAFQQPTFTGTFIQKETGGN